MFINYLKIAFRNMIKHKGYSFINIFGLAVGMAICILLLLWVQFELSCDRFHKHGDDLYRIIKVWRQGEVSHQSITPAPLAPALKEEFPEIINAARFLPVGNLLLKSGEKSFYENGGVFADPAIFHMFTFPLVKGETKTALANPYSIVLTGSLAAKYFGDEEPVGKIIRVDNRVDFTVTGVMKDIPGNSHLQFDFVVPFTLIGKKGLMARLAQESLIDWHNTSYFSYVLLKSGTSYQSVSRKISNYLQKPIPDSTSSLYLQPLKKIHLHSSHLRPYIPGTGDIAYIYLFTAVAFLVLLIACINFMNLTTARVGTRTKEIGMRKVVGARRAHIIKQFFGESLLLAFIALIFALLLTELFLPAFNNLSGNQLTLDLAGNPLIIGGILLVTFFTGIVSGSYPALFLSSFQPGSVLKGKLRLGTRGFLSRKILVVFQFTLTVIFLIGTIVIYKQFHYLQNRKLGFDKTHLVYLSIPEEIRPNYESLKNELLRDSSLEGVTASVSLPSFGRDINTQLVDWEGKDPGKEILMRGVGVDYDFIETFKMEMARGRSFSREFSLDKANYILNETAVKAMGIESPVGKQLTLMGNTGTIIGVVKDYHFRSLHTKIAPLLLRVYEPRWLRFLFARVKPGEISRALKQLESKWKQLVPGYPFQYRFVDDLLDSMFQSEQRIKSAFNYLTLLAICIASLGLFGLASYLAEQRTREIGIRKVFGASMTNIGVLFSSEFLKWIMLANMIAWPISYFFLDRLMRNFAYRVGIGIWPFLLAGLLGVVIALLTVSHQAFKAAAANPIDALKYE
jgi:ABC-type antimicrobial peptide transport system permease subunit